MLHFGSLQKLPEDMLSEIENIFMEDGDITIEQKSEFFENNKKQIKELEKQKSYEIIHSIVHFRKEFTSFK